MFGVIQKYVIVFTEAAGLNVSIHLYTCIKALGHICINIPHKLLMCILIAWYELSRAYLE